MNRKTLLIAGGALVLGAFLLGFVPQYLKARDLDNQLGALRQQLNSEREKSQMDELALLCGYAYLETNLKNYGLASQYSTKFFDRVRAMTSEAPNSGRQAFLQAAGASDVNPNIRAEIDKMLKGTTTTTSAAAPKTPKS